MANKIWVLTNEHNDYDQHGEYFIEVFRNKPTPEQLQACQVPKEDCEWVLQGGGRTNKWEDMWWYLSERSLT